MWVGGIKLAIQSLQLKTLHFRSQNAIQQTFVVEEIEESVSIWERCAHRYKGSFSLQYKDETMGIELQIIPHLGSPCDNSHKAYIAHISNFVIPRITTKAAK